MNRLVYWGITVVFILLGSNRLKAEDFEVWTFVGAGTKLEKLDFSIRNANFFEPDQGGWFLNFTQVSVDFTSKRSLNMGLAYRHQYVKFPTQMRTEYRPMLHLFYRKKLGAFQFRDRNRMEFRIINGQLINRYRNQIQIKFNKFSGVTPYANTEFFFYFNPVNYVRQRTIVGLNIPVKSVGLNVFGGHQSDDILSVAWLNKFMLGTSLNYSF